MIMATNILMIPAIILKFFYCCFVFTLYNFVCTIFMIIPILIKIILVTIPIRITALTTRLLR